MARETHYAPCDKCGEDFIKWPKNRKFCAACQALRDLDFRPGMKKTCTYCEKEFWPSRTSHEACADCSVFSIEDDDKYSPCNQCGKRKRTAPGLDSTCISCVQSSKDMQTKYHLALKKRWGNIQKTRRTQEAA